MPCTRFISFGSQATYKIEVHLTANSLHNLQMIFLPDVAVGAPYEDSGEGIVYIYRGSEKGLVETPMQVCVVVITSQ